MKLFGNIHTQAISEKHGFVMEYPIFGRRFEKHSKNETEVVWSVICSICSQHHFDFEYSLHILIRHQSVVS